MKKKKYAKQLNRSTVVKAIIIAFALIIINFASGLFLYSQFEKHTFRQDELDYESKAAALALTADENLSGDFSILETDAEAVNGLVAKLSESGVFEHYVVFSTAQNGRILGGGLLSGNLADDYGLTYNKSGYAQIDGKTYLFSPAALGDGNYFIAGIIDYSGRYADINNYKGNVVAVLIAAGALSVIALAVYAYWNGNRTVHGKFKYTLAVDKAGKIVKAGKTFRQTFPSATEVQPADNFDRASFRLVKMTGATGEKLLAMRRGAAAAVTKMYAEDVLNADSFIQTATEDGALSGDSSASLSKVFESFVAKGKRTLIGVMTIHNLDQIKTLFGKQMALDIQKIIIKKAREKFIYVYELDFANLGLTYPDGKKLDNLLADMDDVYRYISAPIKMDDNLFTIDLKSGFAMCDSTMTDLSFAYAMQAAEAARQRALDTKIADYIVFHESQKKLYAKYFIKYDIKQMLAEDAFEMEYQPQYNIKEERIEGFEALFRVKKSWNVNVDTFSFITYAERTGAMVQLGDFIFDTGMRFAKRLEGKNVSVSLNVSPVQLMQAGFTENFLRIYKKYDLKPGAICVEITESFLMANFTETLKKLQMLTSNGITVHLDDFGTEYSSLLYIKKLPISTIKIDKEFVKDVLNSKESQAIIKFITNISKLLNLTTICEGVETTQEFDMLNYLGCDTIQGWLIGKSMKPDDALAIVDTFDYKKVAAAKNGK